MSYPYILPKLESRFLPDDNWQVGDFFNPDTDHKIHYALAPVQNPKGTIIGLAGLSEFSEKYIETSKYFNKHGYNFYMMDWAYQGRSSRLKGDPHKRSSDGYDKDVLDLDHFITKIIKTNTNLYILGHSMGGHLTMRYLATQDHTIKAASISTPMLGIQSLKYFPCFLQFLFSPFHIHYVPGGRDWHEAARPSDGSDIFSTDPIRDQVHNAWCLTNPDLQVGNPTYKWLSESLLSIAYLKRKSVLNKIQIPLLMAYADQEVLVDNDMILKIAKKIDSAEILKLKNAKHEILMERDDVRNTFLDKTLELFNQSV